MSLTAKKVRLLLALRQGGITDTATLSAVERVPREEFVPAAFRDRAYDDAALPIGFGQTVSQPLVVARMVQALGLSDRMKVLEIGTGSGYQTAVLSFLSRRVYTIERHRDLLATADKRLLALKRHNVTGVTGDGLRGWPDQAPFERIIVSAAAPAIPESLADQLAPGGIMVLPIGPDRADQKIMRLVRGPDGDRVEEIAAVRFLPLIAGLPERENGR